MEQKETLIINNEELKSILAKYCFWQDYQTKEDCCMSTSLQIETKDKKNNQSDIQFILKYEKKLDSFNEPLRKEYVITKNEVINILNENLLNDGYKIDDFDCNIINGLNCSNKKLNFISLELKKIEKEKTKKRGWKRNV